MGTTLLSKLQLGREATPGTAVAATLIWAGEEARLSDGREIGQAAQWVGSFLPSARRYVAKQGAKITIPSTALTFEQFPHLCEMGIKTATPTSEGSGYLYAYAFPTTAANTIKTYTAECGDDVTVWQVPYVFAQKIELSGAAGEAWEVNAELAGQSLTSDSFTSLSAESGLEVALFQLSKMYLDDSGGTIGTTQITSALVSAKLTIDTGLRALYTADGALTYTTHYQAGPKITGTLTLLHNATTAAEIAAAQAGSARLLRIDILGTDLTTPGTTFDTKAIRFDAAIQYTSVPNLEDKEGATAIALPFEVVDSDDIVPTITVVNNKSSL